MQEPCMAIATNEHGRVLGHMLMVISYHTLIFAPRAYSHAKVYGEGEYDDSIHASANSKELIFKRFLKALTEHMRSKRCLYIEFSYLCTKMFGYDYFRQNGYFPILWQEVHNSLHNTHPYNRLPEKTRQKITYAEQRGLKACLIKGAGNDFTKTVKLLRSHFRLKPRRYVPPLKYFCNLAESEHCKIMISKYKNKIVGACLCIISGDNSYVWYLASRRKSFAPLYPATFTMWKTIEHLHEAGTAHIRFLDAGLPFKRGTTRNFILGFGGKPVSKYRWFKIPVKWLTKILDWCYND